MKLIKRLIVSLITFVAVLGVITIGGYIYIRQKHGIDLFNTVQQLKILRQDVDESVVCPYSYSSEDQVDVQEEVNHSIDNFVKYSEENGYTVDLKNIPSEMKQIIKLSDKEVAALADMVIRQEMDSTVSIGGQDTTFTLKQIQFSDIDTNGNAKLNTVISLDLTPFKDKMSGFPFKYLKKYVPDALYISSTVKVNKGTEAFAYSIEHHEFALNNLKPQQTEDFFHTLDSVIHIGSAEDLNKMVGDAIVGSLIGSEEQTGFAYSLKDFGASDYTFQSDDSGNYFVVSM